MRGRIDRFWELDRAKRWAAVASIVWVVLVLSYAIGFLGVSFERGTVFLDTIFFLVALVLPLILIWLAAELAAEMERQRALIAALAEVAVPLTEALGATRESLQAQAPASPAAIEAAVRAALSEARLAEIAAPLQRVAEGQAALQAALRALDARIAAGMARPAPDAPAPPARSPDRAEPVRERRGERRLAGRSELPQEAAAQPDLPLAEPGGDRPAAPRPDWPDLIRALDFPRDAEDREGFRALKAALRDPTLAQMLQAAEDVLTLLSQEGVYMDDLTPEPGDPAEWRRFMSGARGADVASVGGVRDAKALETAQRLVKSDPIFRDTALFFQRRFDAVLAEFARDATDEELLALADTRSGRAFQLMARLSGSFG
jgi:hypothetical protein